jgi:hypothetical protein
MSQMSLESVLGNDSSMKDALPEVSEREAPVEQAKPEPQAAKPVAPEADDVEDEGPEPGDLKASGLKKALHSERELHKAERKKRQELERALAKYEGHIEALKSKTEPTKQPTPEDDDSAFFGGPTGYIKKQVGSVQDSVQKALTSQRLEFSEMLAKQRHADFDEVVSAFEEALKAQPHLAAVGMQSPDPAEFAYREGKKYLATKDVGGDIDALKAKWRAEWEAENGTSAGEEEPKAPANKTPIPKSNAGARGTGASAASSWSGPTPMASILAPTARSARR